MEDENVASVVDAERAAHVETFTAKFPDTDGLDGFSHAIDFTAIGSTWNPFQNGVTPRRHQKSVASAPNSLLLHASPAMLSSNCLQK